MSKKVIKVKKKDFIDWISKWYDERMEYPWVLKCIGDDVVKKNNKLIFRAWPHHTRHDNSQWLNYHRWIPVLLSPMCLINEKITDDIEEYLITAIDVVNLHVELDQMESLAFILQLFIIWQDFEKSLNEEKSLFDGKQYQRLIEIVHWKLDRDTRYIYLQDLEDGPRYSLNQLITFWNKKGARFITDFAKNIERPLGRVNFFGIPPAWFSHEELMEIFGKYVDLPPVNIKISQEFVPMVKKLESNFNDILNKKSDHKSKKKILEKFPKIAGLKWEEVLIEFTSLEKIRVTAREIVRTFHYSSIGFLDRRKGDLWDLRWETLRDALAKYNGKISFKTELSKDRKMTLKKSISDLRGRLKRFMQIDDDPFLPYDKKNNIYQTKFKIRDRSEEN